MGGGGAREVARGGPCDGGRARGSGARRRRAGAGFRHRTTAGVRRWAAERAALPGRQVIGQRAPEVAVRGKVLEPPDPGGGREGGGAGGSIRLKSEYDDVLVAARALGKPPLEVARIAERDAEQLVAQSKERS